ncbi:MAG: di-trans,poly-cis-decaprenylcistransferase [Candidatus Sedimenticola endophacoides]|uniref:Ditrans,polycis-undecaprenyl-diphosphate synthase ((2E,6E)-farnesyl-diphosphate specific) n=1 Tax=Candidatus Sedimenticola endophacoides TaxID=2548426 RepID=A0A657Q1R5_9GAMM|nr:MAG: di-trans,poly-cis-decaprenylcistransferase [Candidatus Sedimenticola endophacoides]OQX34886.1 MAG: di-trans,poly-cis-decaprenylcistransferase [Candidatus Sedimenticola endophacoides]OQX36163.1 MAG: di-trans,poly-cis-decaprenylcistransferase [Candidatus Sedimenticola endophacoides]OQX39938.1 MAG: di-trans,poly-cis-decaprenylcistransferase [Candidatus Sedimenticola endophacoides]OQX44389.1 MAG: di-trans,poly-cis-decaprenylcistransferase [Candidatus Sedimenticola endophacoides]
MTEFSQLPRHLAIIMDGNGRWARQRGLPRSAGHKAGVASVRTAVEQCALHGIEVLTLFAFSSENWKRPEKEVGMLMDLFMTALRGEVKRLVRNDVRLRIIGEREAFSGKMQRKIAEAETATAGCTGLILQIAANYGGRWDITQAVGQLARRVEAGELRAADIDETRIASALAFADLPDPDLMIRTGGERRISNFILWQTAYAELYFTDRLWPDFDQPAFMEALRWFDGRQRRFGRTGEQLMGERLGSGDR